jgi:hypothetical protein
LRNAATGSPKNITPKREKTRSIDAGSKAWLAASATRNVALAMFLARAAAISGSEMSTPRTDPAVFASAAVVSPVPQPMSTTFSPDFASASASTARLMSTSERWMR